MTLDRAQRRDRQQLPPGQLSIYAGRDFAGTIVHRDGRFIALGVNGCEIGQFETLRGAVRAIPARIEIGGAA